MAKPKEERNRLFKEDWQRKGLNNEELGKKYNLSLGGVKALKQRLRAKDSSLYTDKRPELTKVEREVAQASGGLIQFAGKTKEPSRKVTSTQTSTSTSTKRMTFWLTEEMIKAIKQKAKNERTTASSILRKLLKNCKGG